MSGRTLTDAAFELDMPSGRLSLSLSGTQHRSPQVLVDGNDGDPAPVTECMPSRQD